MGQYFDNDKNLKSERKLIRFNIFDKEFELYTDNGVFAKDKFDYGTRLLLDSMIINNYNARVLDLGCGYGSVGIILKSLYKDFEIDMVDINLRAIKLARDNLKKYGICCNVFVSDGYDSITNKYDYIVSNPPIRAGKDVIRKFLLGSFQYLNEAGELWFVMRKDHGVKSILKELEDKFYIEIIKKDKGFWVVKANVKND